MSNIHITLVGGQTTPVYQGIIATNPDKVILIHSEQTETEANRIYAEMEVVCELLRFDPVDFQKINLSVLKLKNRFTLNDRISINLAGGTKPWSIMFYEIFKESENAELIYIDQNNRLWNLKSKESTEVEFDMDVQFRLLGNELKNFTKMESYTDADKAMVSAIRNLRKFNFQDFNMMTETLYRFSTQTKSAGKNGSTLEWNNTEKCFEANMVDKKGRTYSAVLNSEHIRMLLLNTGWFEFEIAQLLSTWDKTKQLRLNCIFPAKSGSPKNEIDIIVNTGSKLLFVECKTQIKSETDIDKFASAVKVYGGLGSKALFVTDAPMTEKAQEKCADHGIMTFCLQDNFFNLPAEKLLFKMLDSELFNINAK